LADAGSSAAALRWDMSLLKLLHNL
jgi:hypothetical protein